MIRLLPLVFSALFATAALAEPLPTPDVNKLRLASANALVIDAQAGQPIYAKAADEITPIASLTKLMTAMVTLDANLPMDELIDIDMKDFDFLKGTSSRLRLGATLSRHEMLRLALMASENRAASSLARHYPGGTAAFVAQMNRKAVELGMTHTHFSDPTGLTPENVSTANDLARMVTAAAQYPVIREFTTTSSAAVEVQPTGQVLGFNNTNMLVKNPKWDIQLSKTGYIREAGKCLVMLATISSRPFVIVLLDSLGKYTRVGDAQRVKHWLETGDSAGAEEPKEPRLVRIHGRSATKAKGRVKGQLSPVSVQASKTGKGKSRHV
ncbi:MAG TPA: D-alanyl-D-alanine endopeptidase [Casimicrobiaceae bacterium]|nr:D-alanyl-D-alanine endopeptidase [Casimicrobiaceae bacterium]